MGSISQKQSHVLTAGGGGGLGSASTSRPATQAVGREDQHVNDPAEMMRRLKETQSLLAQFSQENTRLAKENDKLVRTRTVRGAEECGGV